jgi:DNA replication and repair protein RecF
VWVNRQIVRRRGELGEVLRVSVFSPDDLRLVQGGPAERRDLLDEALVARHPRYDAMVTEVDRVLRQRAALLRQAGRHVTGEISASLDVWDTRLAQAGAALAAARSSLAGAMEPLAAAAYGRLAGREESIRLVYRPSWDGDLFAALRAQRDLDLRRQNTGVGPHRDELEVWLGSRPARTHASQGEQRCVALALRLAVHQLAASEDGEPPILLLDDVFSELDARRAEALISELPPGQVLLTTATDPPSAVSPDRVLTIDEGQMVAAESGDGR